jgi:hypothetical protein
MQLQRLLSVLLVAIAVSAGPLARPVTEVFDSPRDASLFKRTPRDTPLYTTFKAAHGLRSPPPTGSDLVFSVVWPLKTADPSAEGSKPARRATPPSSSTGATTGTTPKEILKAARTKLGYWHIAVVVGQFSNPRGWNTFTGNMYDLQLPEYDAGTTAAELASKAKDLPLTSQLMQEGTEDAVIAYLGTPTHGAGAKTYGMHPLFTSGRQDWSCLVC